MLIDILLAFSLAAVFVALVSGSAMQSKSIFERARTTNLLLDVYESGSAGSVERPYGNDRTETIYTVSTSSQEVSFASVRANRFASLSDAAGTPLCSTDYMRRGSTPQVTTIQLPADPSWPLTDIEVRDGTAYISADSPVGSDPDILIVDLSDRSRPRLISSLNTGPGISALALSGKRIYAAAVSAAAQLHVIRMDSLGSPALEKRYKLPLPYATATPPLASSIFYDRDRVYLGTEKWDGEEFDIIDVTTPSVPAKVGGLEIGSKVNDIAVRNGSAYITSADQSQLRLVDVRDRTRPVILRSFSPSGWQRQEGKTLSIFEDGLDFGRTAGGYNVIQDHEAFAWASTSSTTLAYPTSVDIPGGVYGIIADRSHVYLAARQAGKELQIFDRILYASSSSSYALPAAPQAMTCDGDHMYILARGAPIMYEISFE